MQTGVSIMAECNRYAEDFKLQAVRLVVEHGYTYRQASEQLGVNGWSIRQWIKKFRQSGQLPPKDQPLPVAEELKAARKELLRLRMENKIFKKSRGVLRQGVLVRYAWIKGNVGSWKSSPATTTTSWAASPSPSSSVPEDRGGGLQVLSRQ